MQRSPRSAHGAVMEPPQKPEPASELARLERIVGTWSGSAEVVSPSPGHTKETMAECSGAMPPSFQGGGKYEWVLGGVFLKGEGWHEMGDGRRVNYVEYITWDPKAKKYRNWWFGDWGEHGQGLMTFGADGKVIRMKGQALDAAGLSKSSERTMTLVDGNTMSWTWTKDSPVGKMRLRGTSRRER